MKIDEARNCRYFLKGRCKSEFDIVLLRGNHCRNETKDACCIICEFKEECEISCDFVYPDDGNVADFQFPSEVEQLKAGHEILLMLYLFVAPILLFAGLVSTAFLSEIYRAILLASWITFRIIPNGENFLRFFRALLPLMLLIIGGLMFMHALYIKIYGLPEKVRTKTTGEKPKELMTITDELREAPKKSVPKVECGNCAHYLKPECPRRYSVDRDLYRTQKTCEIFELRTERDWSAR